MQAIILAGGSGTRFWPLSRRSRPKQLLALEGGRSLLQQTLDRLEPLIPAESVWVCTTEILADEIRRQLPGVPPEQILLEPEGRNTAAAIGWSVRSMPEEARRGVVAVLPADHRIADAGAFRKTLERAAEAVGEQNLVMTLGIRPHRPETGYGYLELAAEPVESHGRAGSDASDDGSGVQRVVRFREKPDAVTAKEFIDSGRYLWNGGIFVFRGSTLLHLVERHLPELAAGLEEIAAEPERLAELYPKLPAISIDFGLMEKLNDLGTLPLDCGWSDLGSWEALAEILKGDEAGNREIGDVVALESSGNLLVADSGTVAVVGVDDLVVVRTEDAVLVIPKDRSQEVRKIITALEDRGRGELL